MTRATRTDGPVLHPGARRHWKRGAGAFAPPESTESEQGVGEVRETAAKRVSAPVCTLPETLAAVADRVEGCLSEVAAQIGLIQQQHPTRHNPLDVDIAAELTVRARNHGKRFRPTMCHWGFIGARGSAEAVPTMVTVGAAMELLHLFALIQDDVMDRSDTRRGQQTLHVTCAQAHHANAGLGSPVLFGDSVATLAGDLALSEATLLMAQGGEEIRALWRTMVVELVEGQLLDLTHAAGRSREARTSRQIARLKSGRYTVTRPVQLGALAAGADSALVDQLGEWGDLVGEVFAVRDDVLGVWGDPARTGKPAGDDLLSGKPTVLLSWAEELVTGHDRFLLELCDRGELTPQQVPALQDALAQAGVRERAEVTIEHDMRAARDLLDTIDLSQHARSQLTALAATVAWRDA